jgi:hypothetical protein
MAAEAKQATNGQVGDGAPSQLSWCIDRVDASSHGGAASILAASGGRSGVDFLGVSFWRAIQWC